MCSLLPLLDKCVSILYNNRLMDVLVFFITTDECVNECVSVLYNNSLINVLVFFITTP